VQRKTDQLHKEENKYIEKAKEIVIDPERLEAPPIGNETDAK
jgi:hypothetical protein